MSRSKATFWSCLSDFQVSDPGDRTSLPPNILRSWASTSNRTRGSTTAEAPPLWYSVSHPTASREREIPNRKAPRRQREPVVVGEVRGLVRGCANGPLQKLPGIADTIDWTESLMSAPTCSSLTPHASRTPGCAAQ